MTQSITMLLMKAVQSSRTVTKIPTCVNWRVFHLLFQLKALRNYLTTLAIHVWKTTTKQCNQFTVVTIVVLFSNNASAELTMIFTDIQKKPPTQNKYTWKFYNLTLDSVTLIFILVYLNTNSFLINIQLLITVIQFHSVFVHARVCVRARMCVNKSALPRTSKQTTKTKMTRKLNYINYLHSICNFPLGYTISDIYCVLNFQHIKFIKKRNNSKDVWPQ